MGYYIVEDTHLPYLVERVIELMAKGWEPLGGIAILPGNEERETMFYQAMILRGTADEGQG